MTAQYQGAGIWNCYVGDKVLVLSEADLLELQEIELSGGAIEKLKDEIEDIKYRIEDIKYKIDSLADNLDTAIYNIEVNVADEVFDSNDFEDSVSKIYKIITQMQETHT